MPWLLLYLSRGFFFTVALEMMDTPQMGCFWKLCFPGTELLFFPSVMKPFAAVNPLQLLTQVYANTLYVSKFFLWCSIVGTRKTGFWPYLFVLRNNCLYTTSVTEQLFHTSACVHRDMKHAKFGGHKRCVENCSRRRRGQFGWDDSDSLSKKILRDRYTLCLCQEPTSCISSWSKTTFSSLCRAVHNQIFNGIHISFWTSLNILHLFPGSGHFPCWLCSSWSSGHTGYNVEGLWWRLFF